VSFVGATVRPPVAVLAPIGVVLAWRLLGWRPMRVPLALFAAGVITFVGTGALGLSILPRYLTVPAVALCLFAGYALVGFTSLAPEHPWRLWWARGSAAATVVGATVRPPVALLAPIGAVLAWRLLGWRRMRVPLALFAAGVITFVGTGALGLSILPRYLTVPAVALCLFAGYALVGFTALAPDHPWRRRWAQGSAAATVLGAIGLIILAPSITNVREEVRFIRATHDSLIATLDDPAVREHLRCGTLTFPTYRLVPDAKWHLPDASIGARSAQRRPTGVEVFALGQKALKRYGFAAGTSPSVNLPSPGFVPIARHGILAAFGRC
jgi:hypothetical protein